ncbi:hypothetical protein CCHR01_11300 [Colletotrichum chrysophilum]|uniref:Uncharacterized protein n=1 Tax=Colletotrichum chrysophilum TaxID=1836956 RepID=A0AAD9AE19_9PEZI|nr:hypothetical protein CCHR01_11300 [Colletotrichum chrysophilum]
MAGLQALRGVAVQPDHPSPAANIAPPVPTPVAHLPTACPHRTVVWPGPTGYAPGTLSFSLASAAAVAGREAVMEKCALLWPATRGTAQAEPASPTNLQRRSQTLSLTRPVHIRDTSMPTIIPSLLPTRSNTFRLLPSRLALTSLFTNAVCRHDR